VFFIYGKCLLCRSRWSCGLRHRSAAAWWLEPPVQILLMARIFVPCVCCVLCRERADHSIRGGLLCLCVCVFVCVSDLETWTVRWPRAELGCCAKKKSLQRCVPYHVHLHRKLWLQFLYHGWQNCVQLWLLKTGLVIQYTSVNTLCHG